MSVTVVVPESAGLTAVIAQRTTQRELLLRVADWPGPEPPGRPPDSASVLSPRLRPAGPGAILGSKRRCSGCALTGRLPGVASVTGSGLPVHQERCEPEVGETLTSARVPSLLRSTTLSLWFRPTSVRRLKAGRPTSGRRLPANIRPSAASRPEGP